MASGLPPDGTTGSGARHTDAAPEVWGLLATARAAAPAHVPLSARADAPAADDLGGQTVSELRGLARARGDDGFSGRAISRAPKEELLRFLRSGRP